MDINYIVYAVLGCVVGAFIGYMIFLYKRMKCKNTIISRIKKQNIQDFYIQKNGVKDDEKVPVTELKSLIKDEIENKSPTDNNTNIVNSIKRLFYRNNP